MTHTSDTRQGLHTIRAATKTRTVRTFDSAAYLATLMAELDRAAISLRLAESREQAGLTQEEMADLLGIHFRSVQNYESPKKDRIPWDKLDEWARITGVTKEWLLHGREAAGTSDGLGELLDRFDRQHDEVMARLGEVLEQVRVTAASRTETPAPPPTA